ncbi:MAG: hypothetical protein ACTSSH_06550 [Candidatus Heimdallarchaeota archaeon]
MIDIKEHEEKVEKLLEHAVLVTEKSKNQSHSYPFYVAASYWVQLALIEQNKILIELLKDKK